MTQARQAVAKKGRRANRVGPVVPTNSFRFHPCRSCRRVMLLSDHAHLCPHRILTVTGTEVHPSKSVLLNILPETASSSNTLDYLLQYAFTI